MKNVCVFGGGGFLGSHLADQLSEKGFAVRIFDQSASKWLRGDQSMTVGTVTDYQQVEDALDGVDIVYNFAGVSDLNRGFSDAIATIRQNIEGNANILEASVKKGISRYVYASSVYVYSRQGGFYRCSKQASELYIEEYCKQFDLRYTILRYGSVYGPRSDESNGLYRLVKSALAEGVVRYRGDADALREYIHVEDAARASVHALQDEFENQSVVLTGQEHMRVSDMLEMLAEMLELKTQIEFLESEYEGHYVKTPYAYAPRLDLKYTPPLHVDFGQGMLRLIETIADENR